MLQFAHQSNKVEFIDLYFSNILWKVPKKIFIGVPSSLRQFLSLVNAMFNNGGTVNENENS